VYTRITTYRAKVGRLEEAQAKLGTMIPEIMSIPGIVHWISAGNPDGACVVVAIYENKAAADAAIPRAQELFGRFAEYYDSPPQPLGYEVLHLESND
jgi:hypothetical protein